MNKTLLFFLFAFYLSVSFSQDCDVPESKLEITESNLSFVFDSFTDYLGGLTLVGKVGLKVIVEDDDAPSGGCKWTLYMTLDNDNLGAITVPLDGVPGEWAALNTYGSMGGDNPTMDIIRVRVSNICRTPTENGFHANFDEDDETAVIVQSPVVVANGACIANSNVNAPGSYLANFNEYYFTVDVRIDLAHDFAGTATNPFRFNPGIWAVKLTFHLDDDT